MILIVISDFAFNTHCMLNDYGHHNREYKYINLHCIGYYAYDDICAMVIAQNVNLNCQDTTALCRELKLMCKNIVSVIRGEP